ncbi:MAG: PAS domain S-box protein [Candidatus Schekmanbacteria bacterium]|nr:MAG: PAS domain S-box protein [Candidatus Schekmanbacteria bacterium]
MKKNSSEKIKRPILLNPQVHISVAIIVILVAVCGFFAYQYGEKISNQRRQMYMLAATEATKEQIQNWYHELISKCRLLMLSHENESMMYSAILRKYPQKNALRGMHHIGFHKYLEKLEEHLDCENIFVVNDKGEIETSVRDEIFAIADEIEKKVSEAIEKRSIVTTPVEIDSTNRRPYIYVVIPFSPNISDGGKILFSNYALLLKFDLEKELSHILHPSSVIRSKTFEELLVLKKGGKVVIMNKLSDDKKRWLPIEISIAENRSPSNFVLGGNEGFFRGIDYRGKEVISTTAYIPELKWGVVEKIDKSEAFNVLRPIISFVVGIAIFIILAFGFFVSRYAKVHGESAARKIKKLRQYRSALLSVYPDIIVNIDLDGNIIWLNETGKDFFGEDAIGKKIAFFMTAMSRDIVKDNYYEFLFSGKKANVTSVQIFKRKDGQERVLSWSSCFLYDDEGRKNGVLATARDITEQKAAEKRIEESEEYLRTIFSSLVDGIVVIDKEMVITDVNNYICDLLGYSREELVGEKLFKIYPDAGYSLLKKSIEKHFEEEVTISGLEINLLAKEGEIIPTSIKAVLLRDAEGKVFGSLGLIRDMREVKILQENLIQAEKLSSIGEMAAGVAHELNNPLTAIIGYSNLLMDKKVSNDVKRQLQIINQQSQRCQNIVSNLLMFSRKYSAKKEYVNLNDLIKSTIALTAYDMNSGGIIIEEEYAEGMPSAFVDGNKLQQVFVNLIQNARYAVEVADKKEKKISVKTAFDEKFFTIEVADTGIGIEKDKIKKIFDPFFTTKEVGKGTGLGLSISYGIIKEHGGDIYVRSKPREGTKFIVKLPVLEGKPEESKKVESPDIDKDGITFGKKRVLVIDDEEVIRDILELYLTDDGHDVDLTASARHALRMIKEKRYDLIFSDIRMPDLDGLSFLEQLRYIDGSLADRVIFITGDSLSLDSFGGDNGNGIENTILTKPFTIEDVRKVMQNFSSISSS